MVRLNLSLFLGSHLSFFHLLGSVRCRHSLYFLHRVMVILGFCDGNFLGLFWLLPVTCHNILVWLGGFENGWPLGCRVLLLGRSLWVLGKVWSIDLWHLMHHQRHFLQLLLLPPTNRTSLKLCGKISYMLEVNGNLLIYVLNAGNISNIWHITNID